MSILGIFGKKQKVKPQKLQQDSSVPKTNQQTREINLKRNYDGSYLKYQYTDIPVRIRKEADISDILAKPATLKFKEDGKLRIYVDGLRIGRVENSNIESVAREWIEKGFIYKAFVTNVDDEAREVKFGVFFYKNEFDPLLSAQPDAPEFRLLGGRGNEDIFFARLDCNRGDRCDINLTGNGRYALYQGGALIGYLPAPAAKQIEQNGEDSSVIYINNVQRTSDLIDIDIKIFRL